MTGMRRGDCADNTGGFGTGFGFGRRFGFGRGRGAGFGFGRGAGFGWSNENRNVSDEASLESGISFLKNQLKALEERLENLRGNK
jgi:hypothetical protein